MNAYRITSTKTGTHTTDVDARREINSGRIVLGAQIKNDLPLAEDLAIMEKICPRRDSVTVKVAWQDQTRLTFGAADSSGGQLMLRSQTREDAGAMERLCPRDQIKQYKASWMDEAQLELVELPDEDEEDSSAAIARPGRNELARITAMALVEAKEVATERGLVWDDKVSRGTMNKRIVAAAKR
jgi:hypothetical protein